MTLAEAATQAQQLAEAGDERGLAKLRTEWDDELEMAARSQDFRERAVAYRAIAQFRFRQKTELLRRGLEDRAEIHHRATRDDDVDVRVRDVPRSA